MNLLRAVRGRASAGGIGPGPDGALSTTFTLTSPNTATAPFSIGHAFKQGDVSSAQDIAVTNATAQVVYKNAWPDGSRKFAIISGTASLVADTPKTINLAIGTASAGTALTTADLKAAMAGQTCSIACSFGTVSWATTDFDSPFQTWVSGAQMSSWIYRKPVGSDAHLVGWLEVRLYLSGAVEVLPWIENGYLLVASPTNKSATYTFTLGSTSRFSAAIDLPHHCRTPLLSGSLLSHWLGTDPGVTPKHDTLYMQATGLVPSYSAVVAPTAAAITALPSTFTPLQQGSFNYDGDSMAATGYQEPIGLLPHHDVLYLTSPAPSTYAGVVRGGYSAGRYCTHYRDETTNRPMAFSTYSTLVADGGASTTNTYTPAASGTAPKGWDTAHSPAVGFMAYLVTGGWYHMEEAQFAATYNHLIKTDTSEMRNGAAGLVQSCGGGWQTRACAWQLRALAHALAITPDADALRTEFIASMHANVDQYYLQYITTANNPWGWVEPGENYSSNLYEIGAVWQQDFVTAAVGYSLAMNLPIDTARATKWAAFFAWKANSVVKRLGDSSGFWYINADVYAQRIASGSIGKQPYRDGLSVTWLSDSASYAAEAATLTSVSSPNTWLGSSDGTLYGEIMPGDRALWGNLLPAISYAVQHGASGASAAYARLTAASNYSALVSALNTAPVWSVVPKRAVPAWMGGQALNTWAALSGTSGAGGASVDAWGAFAVKDSNSELIVACAGGHQDPGGEDNRVVSIRLSDDAPAWTLRKAASTPTADVLYYGDGTPTSRHLYENIHYNPSRDAVILAGCQFGYGASTPTGTGMDAFSLATNAWLTTGTITSVPLAGAYGIMRDRNTGDIWTPQFRKWSSVTNTWSSPITSLTSSFPRYPAAHDTLRNQMFCFQWGDGLGGGSGVVASRTPLTGSAQIDVTFNASAGLTAFSAATPQYIGMDYDAVNDFFLVYHDNGTTVAMYKITPNATNVWDIAVYSPGGATLPSLVGSSGQPGAGINGRFKYIPNLRGFAAIPSKTSNVYFLRTA